MKFLNKLICLFIVTCIFSTNTYAAVGDSAFFGGISEGRKLPKTTEQLVKKNTNTKNEFKSVYKEMLFFTGTPVEFVGNITASTKGNTTNDFGSYKVNYKILKSDATSQNVDINRNIEYNVNYRKENTQTIKDYEISKWTERIAINGTNFELDPNQSKSSISIIEDKTPGVTYYRGDISHRAVYKYGEDSLRYDITGPIYGYESAWSSTETQRLNCTISTKEWQMQFQVRPSVSVGKTLQYSQNEPTAISFQGNFKEVMQNKSGLIYNLYVVPTKFNSVKRTGIVSIPSFNTFEQLIAPDVSYLKGNFAEMDIKKLFSMQVLEGEPSFYKPNQAITRGEFVKMLVRAIKLPIEAQKNKKVKDIVFSDVLADREEYPYIMAAYESGLVSGKEDGKFYIDDPIERQEAIVILIRTLGLENLVSSSVSLTPFTDDKDIASWAKKEVYAANKLGIISGDIDGKFKPKLFMSKAEAAAIVNRLIDYMRKDLQVNYTENIVNYGD